MPKKTVVVTGFGPFGDYDSNPSTDVVRRLQEAGIPGHDVTLITDLMAVKFDEVSEKVQRYWKEHEPDLIVHIGVHGVDKTIKLEQQSFLGGYCRYDIEGCVPPENRCPLGSDATLCSGIDCATIAAVVQKFAAETCPGLIVERSDDPGRYLCGFSYYISLCHDQSKSLFVHIPSFDQEVTLDVVTAVIQRILSEILDRQQTSVETERNAVAAM